MVLISLFSIILLVGVDQIIKHWVENNLQGALPVEFIKFGEKAIINLSYHQNTGAAFSILTDKRVFLIVITSIFLVVGLFLIITKKIKVPFAIMSITLIIAGGIGNLIDRIFRSYVIDYIEVKLFRFAIFNFADCCVVIGAVLFIIYVMFLDKSDALKGKKSE